MTGNLATSSLLRLYRAAQYLHFTRNPSLLSLLSRYPRLDLSGLDAHADRRAVSIRGTDVEVTDPSRRFLLRGSNFVARLLKEAGARFQAAPSGAILEAKGVRLHLENWEELFIAAEVFAEGIYNLSVPGRFVAIDVGMNVGTTSLFFARQPNCTGVYAFEPFPKTIEKAQRNFGLNPSLVSKINVTASGVAARTYEAELEYFEEFKGSVGMNGLPDYIDRTQLAGTAEKVRVRFQDCSEVLAQVRARHPDACIVCKIDCEGAEYEILDALAASGEISAIGFILMEWHLKGAAPLEKLLSKSGFCYLSFSPQAPTHSMVYAWKAGPQLDLGRSSAAASNAP